MCCEYRVAALKLAKQSNLTFCNRVVLLHNTAKSYIVSRYNDANCIKSKYLQAYIPVLWKIFEFNIIACFDQGYRDRTSDKKLFKAYSTTA